MLRGVLQMPQLPGKNKVILSLISLLLLPTVSATSVDVEADVAQDIPVNIEVEVGTFPKMFEVSVPVSLPAHVDSVGVVTVAESFPIINNSDFPVYVAKATLTPLEGWTVVSSSKYIEPSAKEIGFSCHVLSNLDKKTNADGGGTTDESASINLGEGTASVIFPGKESTFTYDVNIPIQAEDMDNIPIGSISFLVDFPEVVPTSKMHISDDYRLTDLDNRATSGGWINPIEIPPVVRKLDLSYGRVIRGIIVPESVDEICDFCFSSDNYVYNIYIPNSVKRLGDSFLRSTAIEELHVPGSITDFHSNALSGCTKLQKIYVDAPTDSIAGAPWGAPNANVEVIWNDAP